MSGCGILFTAPKTDLKKRGEGGGGGERGGGRGKGEVGIQ